MTIHCNTPKKSLNLINVRYSVLLSVYVFVALRNPLFLLCIYLPVRPSIYWKSEYDEQQTILLKRHQETNIYIVECGYVERLLSVAVQGAIINHRRRSIYSPFCRKCAAVSAAGYVAYVHDYYFFIILNIISIIVDFLQELISLFFPI